MNAVESYKKTHDRERNFTWKKVKVNVYALNERMVFYQRALLKINVPWSRPQICTFTQQHHTAERFKFET